MRNCRMRLLAGAMAMAIWPAATSAQTTGETAQQQDTGAVAAPQMTGDEIIVTARRREESLQTVPVAVTVFSGEQLRQSGVKSLNDLTSITPGLRFSSEGEGNASNLSLRGLSKVPIGQTLPSVVSYFAEVALPTWGANLPTYDLSNIQVLKGPQGTLFGRNTIGGAVLLTPQAPEYYVNGFVEGQIGNYDLKKLEAAVNVPIVDQHVALRVAGQVHRRDGFVRDLNGGEALQDIHNEAFRVSLLVEPTDRISNTLIFDYFHANEQPTASIPIRTSPGIAFLPEPYASQIQAAVTQQQSLGLFETFYPQSSYLGQNLRDDRRSNRKGFGIVNTTTFDISDNVLIKNIFGYRKSKVDIFQGSGGIGPQQIPGGPPNDFGAFTILDVFSVRRREMISNELQLQGTSFDGALEWVVGAIYTEDKPYGPQGDATPSFAFGPIAPIFGSTLLADKSEAVFGQFTYDMTGWGLDGLSVTAGYRHSWDEVSGCTISDPAGFLPEADCLAVANLNDPADGVGTLLKKGNDPTYTIGLDWQASPDALFYAVHRKAYRAGNINAPKFESPFTTGGNACGTSGTAACPNLLPLQTTEAEKIEDFEIGTKLNWSMGSASGRLNIALYQNKISGQVQFINIAPLGVPSNIPDFPQSGAVGINAADLRNRGIEVEGNVRPVPNLNIFFNGAYNKTKLLELYDIGALSIPANEINRPTPKFSGTAGATWTAPGEVLGGELVLHGEYYHTSGWRPQAGVLMPGYDLASFRLSLNEIGGSNLDASLWIQNAFDEEYATAPVVLVTGFPVTTVIPGEPQTFGMTLRYRFGD